MKRTLPAVALLLDSARGTYIPQNFVTGFDLSRWSNIDPEDIEILKDHENELYWEAWQNVLDKASFTENSHTWHLMQDGDLWAYCFELMTDEEKLNFGMEVD